MTRILVGTLAGALLGGLYFGGLWLTIRRMDEARRPALRVGISYLARLALAAAAFGLLAARGGFPAVASALVAFLAVRYLLVRRLGGAEDEGPPGPRRLPRRRSAGPGPGTAREV